MDATRERRFAGWVAPIAAALADGRRQVISFARSAPESAWGDDIGIAGWTRRDVLAHLAGGNDQVVQTVLRAAVRGEPLAASMFDADTDAENAARVDERRSWSIDRLIGELERDGEEVQELLSQLREEHRELRVEGAVFTLGQFLEIVRRERHDLEHLEQMRG